LALSNGPSATAASLTMLALGSAGLPCRRSLFHAPSERALPGSSLFLREPCAELLSLRVLTAAHSRY